MVNDKIVAMKLIIKKISNLPTSFFGISILEPIDQYLTKDDLTKSYDDFD